MRSLRIGEIAITLMVITALFSGCVKSAREKSFSEEGIQEDFEDLEKDLDLLEEFDSALKDLESLEVPEVEGTY
ncbi:MAG: hypothetical protein ACE5K4_00140 [Candidatus Hydrothermarchaeota archaeon]